MPGIRDTMREVADSGVDNDEFRTDMSTYMGEICTYESARNSLEQDLRAAGCDIRSYLVDEIFTYTQEDVDGKTIESLKEEYCNSLVDASQPQFTASGIVTAWEAENINHEDSGFLVSKVNPLRPYSEKEPVCSINLNQVTVEQLTAKLNDAFRKRPDKAFGMLTSVGAHWTMLAIDPVAKTYRYMDSKGSALADGFHQKLKAALPEGYQEIPHNQIKQQSDEVSCGLWVIKNCQNIIDNDYNIGVMVNGETLEHNEQITSLRAEVTDILAKKVLMGLKGDIPHLPPIHVEEHVEKNIEEDHIDEPDETSYQAPSIKI